MKNVSFTGANVEKRPYGAEVAIRTGMLGGGLLVAWAPTVGLNTGIAVILGFVAGVVVDVVMYFVKEFAVARKTSKEVPEESPLTQTGEEPLE